ncbi:hypothetical protein [Pseudofrankia asymbiotica]|nr:hypothetical protein [Pseudofrankia asymbiotica]
MTAPEGMTAADVAAGLLAILPGVRRVRVWEDGQSFLDVPAVDAARERPAVDVGLLLGEADAGLLAEVAVVLGLDAGLSALAGGAPGRAAAPGGHAGGVS